ncbi:MAG: alpha/beta hydrolase [Cyclobacteriaceae bacterium]|nr:alpha/beta hydrolase [Cyclobacteriaceae bacterium HetDA_MAG_MS6]
MKTLIPILFLLASCATPKETEPAKLERISYISSADNLERDFFLYLPKDYHLQDNWPLLLFLHGNGERGNGKEDLDYVLKHGPLYETWIQKRDLPFIIIAPQLHMFDKGEVGYIKNRTRDEIPRRLDEGVPPRNPKFRSSEKMTGIKGNSSLPVGERGLPMGWPEVEKDLINMLEKVIGAYRVNEKRLYLTGLSYGGFGTWYLGSKYAEYFAAINPIVGYGHPKLMGPIAEHKLPVWAFAGGRDNAVPVQYFYAGMNKLEKLGHPDVRFTVEEDMGHDVWTRVYAGEDIYNWLLQFEK